MHDVAFCKNYSRLFFCKKRPITDVLLGSQYAVGIITLSTVHLHSTAHIKQPVGSENQAGQIYFYVPYFSDAQFYLRARLGT